MIKKFTECKSLSLPCVVALNRKKIRIEAPLTYVEGIRIPFIGRIGEE